jgi:exosome complex component RRP43
MYTTKIHDIIFRARIIADPTSFEEPLLDTNVSVVVDERGSLISVTQLGLGSSGPVDTMTHCIAAAKKRRSDLEKQSFI